MVSTIDDFCKKHAGRKLEDGKEIMDTWALTSARKIVVSAKAKDGCRVIIGGSNKGDGCKRVLRRAVDECDTSGENDKQGGTVESDCAFWRIDPNSDL